MEAIMTQSTRFQTTAALLALALFATQAGHAAEAWRADGFKTPESVLFDRANDRLIVTNMNGGPGDADGNGYLSLLSADGKLIARDWASGMDAPKGMAIVGGRLYVADITKVRVVDLASGRLLSTIDVVGAVFLNDMTADPRGSVFVTDMLANAIYRIDGDRVELWLKDDALAAPNGIAADGDRLIVGSWGAGMRADFTTKQPGGLLAVDLESKAIAPLAGAEKFGNIDGVAVSAIAVFATDYLVGVLYRYIEGKVERLVALKPGSADIGTDGMTIFVPMMNEGEVVALKP
jgi:sugar lactone lactonase YvrE